jgi:heme exporter protein CcmD
VTLNEFISMGGYGPYLWASFALSTGVLLLNVWLARRSLAEALQTARRRMEETKS